MPEMSGAQALVGSLARNGVEVVFAVAENIAGIPLSVVGSKGWLTAEHKVNFASFKIMFGKFVEYLRTGHMPFPFEQTVELMKLIIAGIRSREQGGRTVILSEIKP